MADVAGKTSNGFDYTGEYVSAVSDSACWAATYRLAGIYRGVRHGRVFAVSKLTNMELALAVQSDIENAWVNEH